MPRLNSRLVQLWDAVLVGSTLAILGMIGGCNELALPPEGGSATNSPPPPARQTVRDPSSTLPPAALDEPVAAPAAPQTPDQPPPERVVAEVGVGQKGRDYGGGVITEPVRQRFRIEQRIVFDIQIPQALRHYQALDPDGKGPRSHEEFMEKIIREHQIDLPELPPGERYVFDPETQQLMVERPVRE